MTLLIEIPENRIFDLYFPEALTPEVFQELCSRNPEMIVESDADVRTITMTPAALLNGDNENLHNA